MYEFEGKLLLAYSYKMFYVSLMATTKGKKSPTIDTQKIKGKEQKHTTPKKWKTHRDSKNERHQQKDFLKNSQKTTTK